MWGIKQGKDMQGEQNSPRVKEPPNDIQRSQPIISGHASKVYIAVLHESSSILLEIGRYSAAKKKIMGSHGNVHRTRHI